MANEVDDKNKVEREVRRTRDRMLGENSIRPSKRRAVRPIPAAANPTRPRSNEDASEATSSKAQSQRDENKAVNSNNMPDSIRSKFVQVGRKYYFPDGARAFTDRGVRLTTPSENTEVIRSLVTIAQARGWDDITVTGTERFRREVWFAAKLAGLGVRGYKPNEFEVGRLARTVARQNSSQRDGLAEEPTSAESALNRRSRSERRERPPEKQRDQRDRLATGRLVDHGRANYRNDSNEPMSYFVKLETPKGERTLWGIDLERALRESLTKPQIGEEVGLQALRQEPVTVKARQRDNDGQVVSEKQLATHRNKWIIEKRPFFQSRADAARTVLDTTVDAREAVKRHPELAGTYFYLRGAEEIAKQRIRDPEDQRKFVATVRNALADSIARGEPLPPMRLRERQQSVRSGSSPRQTPERERELARG